MSVEPKISLEGEGAFGMRQVAQISCKCPKSKCLLMYCECFSKGVVCNERCSCYQCRNNSHFEEKRQKARKAVLERDPNAFTKVECRRATARPEERLQLQEDQLLQKVL